MISIIIPVYNSHNTLNRCVDSIVSQRFQNIELILVDDGSIDESPQICDEYARIDNRIKVIHKNNEGVSKARNTGIEVASGEWIAFIDSDDCISQNYFPEFIDNSVDLYFLRWSFMNSSVSDEETICPQKAAGDSIKAFFDKYLYLTVCKAPWAKLYKTDILKSNDIRFDADYRMGEDCLFNLCYYQFVHTVEAVDSGHYLYERGENDDEYRKRYHLSMDYSIGYLSRMWYLYCKLPYRNNDFLDGERRFYKSLCVNENCSVTDKIRWSLNKTIFEINCELGKYNSPIGRVKKLLIGIAFYANSILSKIS